MEKLKTIVTLDDRLDFELETLRRGSSYNSEFTDVPSFLYIFYPKANHTEEQIKKIREFASLVDARFRRDESPNYYPSYAPGDAILALRNELLLKWLGKEVKPYAKVNDRHYRPMFNEELSKVQQVLSQKTTPENVGEQLLAFYNVACTPESEKYFDLGIKVLNDSIELVKENDLSIETQLLPLSTIKNKTSMVEKLGTFLITPYVNHLNIDERFNNVVISSLSLEDDSNKKEDYASINGKIEDYLKMGKGLFLDTQKQHLNKILEERIIGNLRVFKAKGKDYSSGLNNAIQIIELMKEFGFEIKQDILNEMKDQAFLKEDTNVIMYLGKAHEFGYDKMLSKARKDIDYAYLNPSSNLAKSVCSALNTLLEFDDDLLGLSDREVFKALGHLEEYPRDYNKRHRELLKSDLERRARDMEGINIILSYREFLKPGIYDNGRTAILGPSELEYFSKKGEELLVANDEYSNFLKYVALANKVNKAIVFTGKISRDFDKESEDERKKMALFFTAIRIADYKTKKTGKLVLASCGCGDEYDIKGVKYNLGAEIRHVKHTSEGEDMLDILDYESKYPVKSELPTEKMMGVRRN